MVLVDIIELASISFVRGEYLEDAKLFFKVKISYSDLDSNFRTNILMHTWTDLLRDELN